MTFLSIATPVIGILTLAVALLNYRKVHLPSVNVGLLKETGYDTFPERFRVNYSNSSSNSCYIWISLSAKVGNIKITMDPFRYFSGRHDSIEIHVNLGENSKGIKLNPLLRPVEVDISCTQEQFHLAGLTAGIKERYMFRWDDRISDWGAKDRISTGHYIEGFGKIIFGEK